MAGVTVFLGPATYNLDGVYAGDDTRIQVKVTEGDNPFNLTGYTATAQVRTKSTDDTPVINAQVTVPDAPGGVVMVHWLGADVRTILAGKASFKGVWDLQIAASGSDTRTILKGTFEADMDVTRP